MYVKLPSPLLTKVVTVLLVSTVAEFPESSVIVNVPSPLSNTVERLASNVVTTPSSFV